MTTCPPPVGEDWSFLFFGDIPVFTRSCFRNLVECVNRAEMDHITFIIGLSLAFFVISQDFEMKLWGFPNSCYLLRKVALTLLWNSWKLASNFKLWQVRSIYMVTSLMSQKYISKYFIVWFQQFSETWNLDQMEFVFIYTVHNNICGLCKLQDCYEPKWQPIVTSPTGLWTVVLIPRAISVSWNMAGFEARIQHAHLHLRPENPNSTKSSSEH